MFTCVPQLRRGVDGPSFVRNSVARGGGCRSSLFVRNFGVWGGVGPSFVRNSVGGGM